MENESFIQARYKQEKQELTKSFVKPLSTSLFLFLTPYILMSTTYGSIDQIELYVSITLIVLCVFLRLSNSESSSFYSKSMVFLWVFSLKFLLFAYFKFPHFAHLIISFSLIFLYYGHIELIYNRVHGYLTIIFHMFLWCAVGLYSGVLTQEFEIGFCLAVFLVLQLMMYKFKAKQDLDLFKDKVKNEICIYNVTDLINTVPEGIVVLGESNEIIMKNAAYQKLIGETRLSEMNHIQKYHNIMYKINLNLEEDVRLFRTHPENTISFGIVQINMNYIECTATKIKWDRQPAIVLTFRDLAKTLKLEKDVSEVIKTVKILSGVSHELKTPMNFVINNQLEVLRHKDPEIITNKITQSVNTSYYLLSMINDMIDYSYLKSGTLKFSFSSVKFKKIIEESVEMMRNIYFNCDFIVNFCEYCPSSIISDSNRFRQIIINLLSISTG